MVKNLKKEKKPVEKKSQKQTKTVEKIHHEFKGVDLCRNTPQKNLKILDEFKDNDSKEREFQKYYKKNFIPCPVFEHIMRVKKGLAKGEGPAKVKKPVIKKQKNLQEKYEFVIKNLENREDYTRLSFSLELLFEVLNVLSEDERISRGDIEKYVKGTHQKKSIQDIFNHFGVKQESK